MAVSRTLVLAPPRGRELVVHRPAQQRLVPDAALWFGSVVAVCLGWGAALWVSSHLTVDPVLHASALFAHLAAMVLGFGAVVTLDAYALLWLLGRRSLDDLCRLAHGVHALVWVGLAVLLLTGALLSPDTASALTRLKLGLVLVVALNGLNAAAVQRRLDGLRGLPVSRGLLLRAGAAGLVSQGAWWGAVLIGFLNAQAPS